MRGCPGSQDVPVHHPECLPGEVLNIFLAEGSVVPAPIFLPSLGGHRRGSPGGAVFT